jgi:large subunit ribosomal protein L10
MPTKTRKQREETVAELNDVLGNAQGIVVADYVGVKTPELNELRLKLRPSNSECRIVKNTLTKIALKSKGFEPLAEFFTGQSALVIQKGDTSDSLKALFDFSKTHENWKIRAGVVGGTLMKTAELKALASLPPRPVLLSQLLRALQSPVTKLASVMSAPTRQLATVLSNVAKKKEAPGA